MKTKNYLMVSTGLIVLSLSALAFPAVGEQVTVPGRTVPLQPGNSSGHNSLGHVERASQLIGREVRTSANQNLGKIDNLVVDLTSGHILYAVVSTPKGKVAVAPEVITEGPGNTLRATVDQQKFDAAPQFTSDIDQPGTLSKADFVSKVYQYFGQNEWWQGGAAAPNAGSFNDVHKVTDLKRMNVMNVDNQKIGDVNSVVMDLPAGRVVYVILAPDSSLKLGNNLYALPPNALTPSPDGKSLVSNLSQEKLASAPHFASNKWPNLANPAWAAQVYQYYGKQAYFQSGGGLQPTGR